VGYIKIHILTKNAILPYTHNVMWF